MSYVDLHINLLPGVDDGAADERDVLSPAGLGQQLEATWEGLQPLECRRAVVDRAGGAHVRLTGMPAASRCSLACAIV